jgi:hypothetical protein
LYIDSTTFFSQSARLPWQLSRCGCRPFPEALPVYRYRDLQFFFFASFFLAPAFNLVASQPCRPPPRFSCGLESGTLSPIQRSKPLLPSSHSLKRNVELIQTAFTGRYKRFGRRQRLAELVGSCGQHLNQHQKPETAKVLVMQ